MKRLCLSSSLIAIFLLTSVALYADQQVKKRMSFGQQGMDSTTYIKGQRSRDEMNVGPMTMVTIHQCDTGKTITLNDSTKTYMVTQEQQPAAAPGPAARPGAARKPEPEAQEAASSGRKGGVITINTSVQDTNERKDFFGYKARHLKTSMDMEASPDSCNPGSTKMSTDGWYIDFEPGVNTCYRPEASGGPMGRGAKPDCQDRMKYTGPGVAAVMRLGFPVDVTTTVVGKDGKEQSFRQQALEISKATLDPALFDAPADYRAVNSQAEMMGMGGMGMGAMMGGGRAQQAPPRTMAPQGEAASAPPRQSGKLRIGVAPLRDKTGQGGFDSNSARPQLVAMLERFGYDVVTADGSSDEEVTADARQKNCDYVLFNDVSGNAAPAKKKGGMFGKALATAMGQGGDPSSAPAAAGFDGSVAYRLFKMNQDKPELEGSAEAKGNVAATFDQESRDVASQVQKDMSSR